MWPNIITKYSLEEEEEKTWNAEGCNSVTVLVVFEKKREKKNLQKISIHADFGYLVRRPHYISIPGGKWQINAAHITVSISTWQCMFCMNEYWCTAFPPRWFVFKLTLCLPFFWEGEGDERGFKKKETAPAARRLVSSALLAWRAFPAGSQ